MTGVKIDERCQGHGQCYQLFPQMFEPDEEGYGLVRPDATIKDNNLLHNNLLDDAVACCPENAIVIVDSGA
ncbi:hypothetical protein MCHIJ_50830 [Mycolicibacterium chitae]|uniref:Ferredoxin 1 n=1 Tax=Mycolicibacterium chitae TaxID=1792 RepID=A0A448IA13_MYCCI|nr:ferredoxin [Mycolicibacterium chitae]MCV7105073.1 ferredoxin [Mycolicibacterium chitae]BBZ05646.1 hypothetical protein MCHIJ_50830 [Mycolicibacterium chitae]VEG49258.1 ferredoxin 1 [Mycolicibacterium chitae]